MCMQIFIAQLFVKINLLEESKDATSGGLYCKLGCVYSTRQHSTFKMIMKIIRKHGHLHPIFQTFL